MRRFGVVCWLGLLLCAVPASAQHLAASPTWTGTTRAIMTGVSDSSDPGGYKVYSGFSMEAELSRSLSRHVAVALSLSTQSREVDYRDRVTPATNLGSIEVLPLTATLRYRFRPDARFHPYAGAGLGLTVFWEKSGALDSADLDSKLGVVAEVGFDYDLSSSTVFSVQLRASRLETDLTQGGTTLATLALHPPSTLGLGVGFRF